MCVYSGGEGSCRRQCECPRRRVRRTRRQEDAKQGGGAVCVAVASRECWEEGGSSGDRELDQARTIYEKAKVGVSLPWQGFNEQIDE